MIDNVMPRTRPMFTFRIDPKLLAETLLAMADLRPDTDKGVQCFYYGDGYPLGFCAQNQDNGMMIDALVVPLSLPQKPESPELRHRKCTPKSEHRASFLLQALPFLAFSPSASYEAGSGAVCKSQRLYHGRHRV